MTQVATATMRIASVAPRTERTSTPYSSMLASSKRRTECGIVSSPSRIPDRRRPRTTSTPRPTTAPTMSTQATATPAAMTKQITSRPCAAGSVAARAALGLTSVRASGSSPSLMGWVTGRPGRPAACNSNAAVGETEPGHTERPAAEDIADVVHAEKQQPEYDHDVQRDDQRRDRRSPPSPYAGHEQERDGAVADDRAERDLRLGN